MVTTRAPSEDDQKKNSYLGKKYNNFINSYVTNKDGEKNADGEN
jgi:hypothetical protein